MSEKREHSNTTWVVGCFSAAAVIIAAIIGLGMPFAQRLADIYFPPITPNQPTTFTTSLPSVEFTPKIPAQSSDTALVVNGTTYQMPTISTPHCVALEIQTGMNNVIEYDVIVPDGWVMAWDSWKAEWDGGSYNSDGLLIIKGPYSGKIRIDTGGSCSGPIEWYDYIVNNRRNAYPVPSRSEYIIP